MQQRPAITAVLVLYRMSADESDCFITLRKILLDHPELAADFTLLLYDNSPDAQPLPTFPAPLLYQHDANNGGIAAAYNAGLQISRSNGSPWLLLLDQDTSLQPDYLRELRETSASVLEDVVAIVPRLVQNNKTLSPLRLPRLSHSPLPQSIHGVLAEEVFVFNSAALVRVSAIRQFPTRFWLDYLDHAVFTDLQRNGGRVWLTRSSLAHQLAILNMKKEMSLTRYSNILMAERDFYRIYGDPADLFWYRLRRIKQTLGHLSKVPDKRFAWLSAKAALGLLGPTPPR